MTVGVAPPTLGGPEIGRLRAHSFRIAGGFALLVLWELVFRMDIVPQRYFSGPVRVIEAIGTLAIDPGFWANEFTTVLRAVAGLLYGTMTGLVLALAAAYAPLIGRAVRPLVELMRSLPPAALVPLAIFSLGLGPSLFAFIVGFAVVWTVYLSAANALASSDRVLVATGRSLGLSRAAVLWHVRIPGALPETMTGIRVASAQALMATVAAEMLAGQNGLGYMLMDSAFTIQTDVTFALLFIAGITGALLNYTVMVAARRACQWQHKLTAQNEGA